MDNCVQNTIAEHLSQAMKRDQHRLRRQWQRIQRSSPEQLPEDFRKRLEASVALRTSRSERLPTPNLDSTLPIYERRNEIRELLANNQVLVLSGETGSGKSTQLPLIALEMGFGVGGLIGHTQPRRLAARSVAARLAQQLGTNIGEEVGFKIRFSDQTNDKTFIKLMTDGILLAETQHDRFLDQYEMLIIDEAHERSLNIDFVLGFLKNLLPKRPDLKIIITSATIDTERFAEHFADSDGKPAPVLHVEGRTFPVEIIYSPPESQDGEPGSLSNAIVDQCRELVRKRDGDILVFLATEQEIRTVAKKLRGVLNAHGTEILPLYARLSPKQQNEIFQTHSQVRIVLATNVAESSITVPGIRYVVDSGTARISRYSPRSKVQRLPIEPISQASANQRAGRCGRVAEGICVRLYSAEDFASRSEFTTPEIRRTNLAGTILQLLILGYGDIERFPFIDPPTPESIRDGYKTLFEIGAVDGGRKLTDLGKKLGRLPVDPRIGRMLYAAADNRCLAEVLIIASSLEIQDPRIRPAERQAAADEAHAAWNDANSDFIATLNLWDFIHRLKADLSRSKFRVALEKNFLSYTLVVQWLDIHRQLMSMVQDAKLPILGRDNNYNQIHRSLLTGLLSSVAMLGDRHEYTGAGGIKFHLWPGSGVFGAKPKWIMASEILETTRRYGRTVAKIEPDWVMPLAGHLVKHSYVDPFWSAKNQTVMAYQNTSLYGLPIQSRQRVHYSKIDPTVARDLFIEDGLMGDELRHDFDFHVHNLMLLDEVAKTANKTRDRGWVVDPSQLIQFYREHLPAEAVDCRSLDSLLKHDSELNGKLTMTMSDLGLDDELKTMGEQMPEVVSVGSIEVPVDYRFEPGNLSDGATVELPLAALGQVDDVQLGWLIPGLLQGRVAGLIRSLPKNIRRNLVPAPDVAAEVVKRLRVGEGDLLEQVASHLSRFAGEPVLRSQFDLSKLDRHLLVNVRLVDDSGQMIAEGRTVSEIRTQLSPEHLETGPIKIDDQQWNQTGLTDWNWDELPEKVEVARGATLLVAYPAIIDEGEAVGLGLVDSSDKAKFLTSQGICRLFCLQNKKRIRSQVQWLPALGQAKINLARWIAPDELTRWLGELLPRVGMLEGQPEIRTRTSFEERNAQATMLISVATQEIAAWLQKLAAAGQDVALALENLKPSMGEVKASVKRQLQFLFADETLNTTPWEWLKHYPRYLNAIVQRITKLSSSSPADDRRIQNGIDQLIVDADATRTLHLQMGWFDPELTQYRWMIEEFRVSQFAQQLGTAMTVSEKRLEKQRKKVRAN
ncbi:MAG: ATP-dependent RNA helicase HrpA [Pirellulaceae bacterium]